MVFHHFVENDQTDQPIVTGYKVCLNIRVGYMEEHWYLMKCPYQWLIGTSLMNMIDLNFCSQDAKEIETDSGNAVCFHYMMEKLTFLFSQLEPKFIEPIISNQESSFGATSHHIVDTVETLSRVEFVGYAVTRFLYAVSGQSHENTAFAFTCAQIRAIQLGADDCDSVEKYS